MTHAIRFHETGGPEVLRWEQLSMSEPDPGQARVRQAASGVNFVDVYIRRGQVSARLPSGLGFEGAGVVEAIASDVTTVQVGDRVAYFDAPLGAYAEAHLIPASRLVPIPGSVSDEAAASVMMKGLTAQYLVRRVYPVRAGDVAVVPAAAGGVGLILCQWLQHLGATVVGVVGSDAKAELARANGCAHQVVFPRDDLVAKVREITEGRGAHVIYDGVGRDTWDAALDSLARFGVMVSFGMSSGPVPPVEVGTLQAKGSLFLTRPSVFHYMAERTDLLSASAELFGLLESGVISPSINHRFPLEAAADAHRVLEARKTTCAVVLMAG
jgi:NADPH2:quinone reductase